MGSNLFTPKVAAAGVAVAAVASWYFSYEALTDYVSRSSALARQTLFNIRQSREVRESGILGGGDSASLEHLCIDSRIQGEMNHIGGFADINFKCCGENHKCAKAHVVAVRRGASWKTQYLALEALDGSDKTIVIEDQLSNAI